MDVTVIFMAGLNHRQLKQRIGKKIFHSIERFKWFVISSSYY